MAVHTVTIYGSASACIDSKTPNTPNTTKTIIAVGDVDYIGSGRLKGIEKFIAPEPIRGKRAVSAVLYVYARRKQIGFVETVGGSDLYAVTEDWYPEGTTWNNKPELGGGIDANAASFGAAFSWRAIQIDASHFETAAWMASRGVYFNNYFEYYTSNSDHKPYIVLTYEDGGNVGLYWKDLLPNDVFQDEREGVRIGWRIAYKPGTILSPTLQKAVISWSFGNQTYTKETPPSGGNDDYTMPAAQLPTKGTVTWNVTTTDSAGNVNISETATFYTTDATGYAYPRAPINEYIDGSKTVPLQWGWNISTGTRPTRGDIQTSIDGGITWQNLGSVYDDGDLTYYAEPGALPAGNVIWRVRGYNTDNEPGHWSDGAAIVVRRAPNAPMIYGVTPYPRPIVNWQAEGQQAYQLQVGDWDSGAVYGTYKSAQVPVFLPDGHTAVRLRVQNSFGLWSKWAEAAVTIQNRTGEKIVLRTKTVLGAVRLSWTTQGEYPSYLIYRDGELMGETAGREYTDYYSNGKSVYFVRGVNLDSTYTDSPRVAEILTPVSGLIAQVGVWDWMLLNRRVGSRPARGGGTEADVTLTTYSGRPLPVAEISGHRQRRHSYAYSLRTLEELHRLEAMIGSMVVYKHRDGDLAVGLLGGVSWSRNREWMDVSFDITEVDHHGIAL